MSRDPKYRKGQEEKIARNEIDKFKQGYRTVGPMTSPETLKKTNSTFSNDEFNNRAKQIRRDNDIVKTPKCSITVG